MAKIKKRYKLKPKKFDEGGNLPDKFARYGQAGADLAIQGANAGGSYLSGNAYNSNTGKVKVGEYATGEALGWAGKGATMGMAFGPEGAAIGAGLGLLGGATYGIFHGNKINHDADIAHQQQVNATNRMNSEIAAAKLEQQKQYSKAYYANNPTYGTVGQGVYAYGGYAKGYVKMPKGEFMDEHKELVRILKSGSPQERLKEANEQREEMKKYPDGGKLTPQQWDEQNTKLGYAPSPYSSGAPGSYKSYYNPKQYSYDATTQQWKGLTPDANIQYNRPLGDHFFEYKPPVTPIKQNATPEWIPSGKAYVKGNDPNGAKYNYVIGQGYVPETNGIAVEQKAYGGYTYAPGGKLNQLASDTVKAEGNTHAEGGIDLLAGNGKPYAEVEDQEIIKDDQVFSDRLKTGKVTFAKAAEKLSRVKGKFEKNLKSNDFRTKDTAERMVANTESQLNNLFNEQEEMKARKGIGNDLRKAYGGDIKYSGGGNIDWNSSLASAVPFIDNAYNAALINQTAQIPTPTTKVAYAMSPVAMKTTYNINPALNEANKDYQAYNTDVTQNTLNSNTTRANKLAAYSSLLGNKSNLYGNKENIETQLKNQDALNRQQVYGTNLKNAQDIANTNLSATDSYNYAKMERANSILQAKSGNMANAVADATKAIQDKRYAGLDQERMILDSAKYGNSAGLARMIGTTTMDNLIKSNPDHYKTIEKALLDSGQAGALKDFYAKYGKR